MQSNDLLLHLGLECLDCVAPLRLLLVHSREAKTGFLNLVQILGDKLSVSYKLQYIERNMNKTLLTC